MVDLAIAKDNVLTKEPKNPVAPIMKLFAVKVYIWTLLTTIVTSGSIIDMKKFLGYTSLSNNSKTP